MSVNPRRVRPLATMNLLPTPGTESFRAGNPAGPDPTETAPGTVATMPLSSRPSNPARLNSAWHDVARWVPDANLTRRKPRAICFVPGRSA